MAFAVAIFMLVTGCAGASGTLSDSNGADPRPARELTVFAAISLSEAFREIAVAYESEDSGVSVELNLAGSQRLRTQLEHGAPGDVFASADHRQMELARIGGLVDGKPAVFATNRLAVIVPKEDPAGMVTDVYDMGNQGIKIALALPDVPAGRYAQEMISRLENSEVKSDLHLTSRILANVVTLEPNVRGVAAKVALGEVDAGVIYVTGVSTDYIRDRVRVIPIPEQSHVVAAYPIAALREAGDSLLAEDFIRFVLSPKGQLILAGHGFGPASDP
ncbi:MAG: molybdate ABC transporter substrate-binding protein [SAR202 cluster bacterium Io17-Chloro-G2]|nr:MAG: molybdate ABC transporter substrate-binding protein [SAR202 cluster bacterium Io17-Chloro-G2]